MKHQYYCPNCNYHREGLLDYPAIGIGSYSTTCPECNSHYKSYVPHLEYYTVENTGWSSGTSWFRDGGTDANPLRFQSHLEATEYALMRRQLMGQSLWRVVHTTIEREENREVITKEWNQL